MRDIRSDLQERVTLVDEQTRAACTYFEKTTKQLQNERDARIADLKSCLAMIAKFMDFQQRFFGERVAPSPVFPARRTCGSFHAQAQ